LAVPSLLIATLAASTQTQPRIIQEGVGWERVTVGANANALIDVLGFPDQHSRGRMMTWDKAGLNCLLNDKNEAIELRFEKRFVVFTPQGAPHKPLGGLDDLKPQLPFIDRSNSHRDELIVDLGLKLSRHHLLFATVTYPDDKCLGSEFLEPKIVEGAKRARSLMIIVKPSLTGDEPLDVLQYAASNEPFPQPRLKASESRGHLPPAGALVFLARSASLILLSTGKSCSSSWQAASISSPVTRLNGIAMVNGRV
jgi:hypothetical protein